MNKLIIKFFIFFFLLAANAQSAEKIVYLDVDFILANSNNGKSILLDLENINKNNVKILKQKEESIKNEENKLKKQKNIISSEAYNEKLKNLRKQIKQFRSEKDKMVTEFKKTREIKINEFIKLIDKLLGDYVEKNSIDLVLNKKDILMGKNNYNITEEILKIVNNTN